MQSLLHFQFWWYAIVYIFSVLFLFFMPGLFVLKKAGSTLSSLPSCVVSIAIGLSMWGMQGYVFGYVHMRFLTYIYVLLWFFVAFIQRKQITQYCVELWRDLKKIDKVSVALLCIGVLIQSLQMIGSGLETKTGMSFFRVNAQDGIFHLSLISSMVRQFPPVEPGASNVLVANYHYWSDLIMAEQSRIFHIPISYLFFQYTTVFISLLTGLTVISLIKIWKGSTTFLRFALFFLFFGGDCAYLFMLYLHQIWGFYTAGIDNGATQFLNMPHSMAKYVFFASLIPFEEWILTKKVKIGFIVMFLSSVLFGLKIYFALFASLGLGFVFIVYACRYLKSFFQRSLEGKQDRKFLFQFFFLLLFSTILGLAIYLPPNHASGGLGYYPLEWPKLFLSQSNLDWKDWEYRYAIYQLYHNTKWLIAYNIGSIVVCLLCVHGTRIFGFLVTKKHREFFRWQKLVYFIPTSIIFTILGLYTLQKNGAFNVFNFFAMSLSILALLSAYWISMLWSSKKFYQRCIVVLIVLLTIPRVVFETQKITESYIQSTDVTYISYGEQQALSYINTHTKIDEIVQSDTSNTLDVNTPYVSFFSNRQTYISGQNVLDTHGQPTLQRFQDTQRIFSMGDGGEIIRQLKDKKISVLYVKKTDESLPLRALLDKENVIILYENAAAKVYDIGHER